MKATLKQWLSKYRILIISAAVIAGVFCLLFLGETIGDRKYEVRRQEDQQKIEQLGKDARALSEKAKRSDERAESLELSLKVRTAEVDALRAQVDQLAAQRAAEGKRYEKAVVDLDSVSDYNELRRLNCERRARLGYPCQ